MKRKSKLKWRESFTVWIDFIGDRSQVGPLLDHIAMLPSGGSMVIGPPLCDQSWTIYPGIGDHTRNTAEAIFNRLAGACKTRWSPYIRLRLLHDDKPDRCQPPTENTVTRDAKGNRVIHVNAHPGRGPIVLRKYQRGKLPQMPVRKLRKKGARPDVKR